MIKNKMSNTLKYVLLAVVVSSVYGCNKSVEEIDLNLVLDVTLDTLTNYSEKLDAQKSNDNDQAFIGFAEELAVNYNQSQPVIYKGSIGVSPQKDASLLAFDDSNANKEFDEGEDALFKIEIDGEKSRIIASSRSGAVNDHYFSGTSLLAGYLIGSMLMRQKGAGVNSKSLANKKPVTSKAAAKARAGSGSHSKGK
jgi:hypothetical protein